MADKKNDLEENKILQSSLEEAKLVIQYLESRSTLLEFRLNKALGDLQKAEETIKNFNETAKTQK